MSEYSLAWPQELLHLYRSMPDRVWGMQKLAEYASDCPNCGGLGRMIAFVIADSTPDGRPLITRWIEPERGKGRMYHGYNVYADCPVCNGNSRGGWLTRMCGLVGDELDIRLDDYMPYDGKQEARRAAGELLSMAPEPHGWASFVGGYGVGKSLLLKALVNGFRLAGVLAVYVPSTGDLLQSVKDLFGRDSGDAADILIMRYRGVRVLALDEVDRFNPTPWARDVVFRVLNERYARRGYQLTMFASNKTPEQIGADNTDMGYLGSRMSDGRVVMIGGEDMRG